MAIVKPSHQLGITARGSSVRPSDSCSSSLFHDLCAARPIWREVISLRDKRDKKRRKRKEKKKKKEKKKNSRRLHQVGQSSGSLVGVLMMHFSVCGWRRALNGLAIEASLLCRRSFFLVFSSWPFRPGLLLPMIVLTPTLQPLVPSDNANSRPARSSHFLSRSICRLPSYCAWHAPSPCSSCFLRRGKIS